MGGGGRTCADAVRMCQRRKRVGNVQLTAGDRTEGGQMAKENPAQARTLAAKLDRLFRAVHPPGRGEYSYEEVASSLRKQGGPTISGTYVWQLRKGIRDNPTKKHLEALALFFGVEPSYFFDEAASAQIAAELELLAAMRDAEIRSVALRSAGLSPDSLGAIRGMIEHARRLEGLPDDDPGCSPADSSTPS